MSNTCTDCKLRGWSETTDEHGEAVRTGEVIDLCARHAGMEAELTRLREQVAELSKCECVVNTNWHEGVPYDYKVTCSPCDTQLKAANIADAFCEVAAKMDSFDYHPLMIAWKELQNWDENA